LQTNENIMLKVIMRVNKLRRKIRTYKYNL